MSLDESLISCTVRISHEGGNTHDGTGFFGAQGVIITCFHVIDGAKGKPISIWWRDKDYPVVVKSLPEDTDKIDLALLGVEGTIPEHPWVALDSNVEIGDELYTFGYPDQYSDGDPGTFEYEGLTGGDFPLLKFKEGQVRPGFSGSPLLNLRTNKVCGVIKKSRDRSSDLGGRAIPASVILATFPELKPQVIPPNPFVPLTGKIDNQQYFFNRKKELRRVIEILNSGGSVALIGERQIGKSSFLKAIFSEAEKQLQPPRRPIYLNLQNIHNEDEFYPYLCDEIGIDICSGYFLTRALNNQKLLLLIDEVEKIKGDGFTYHVRDHLRGLADGSNAPLRLIIATGTPLSSLFDDTDKIQTSPLANICVEERLEAWSEAIARDFIINRLQSTPIIFPDQEIGQMIVKRGGHPQKLMQLCHEAYSRYRETFDF